MDFFPEKTCALSPPPPTPPRSHAHSSARRRRLILSATARATPSDRPFAPSSFSAPPRRRRARSPRRRTRRPPPGRARPPGSAFPPRPPSPRASRVPTRPLVMTCSFHLSFSDVNARAGALGFAGDVLASVVASAAVTPNGSSYPPGVRFSSVSSDAPNRAVSASHVSSSSRAFTSADRESSTGRVARAAVALASPAPNLRSARASPWRNATRPARSSPPSNAPTPRDTPRGGAHRESFARRPRRARRRVRRVRASRRWRGATARNTRRAAVENGATFSARRPRPRS